MPRRLQYLLLWLVAGRLRALRLDESMVDYEDAYDDGQLRLSAPRKKNATRSEIDSKITNVSFSTLSASLTDSNTDMPLQMKERRKQKIKKETSETNHVARQTLKQLHARPQKGGEAHGFVQLAARINHVPILGLTVVFGSFAVCALAAFMFCAVVFVKPRSDVDDRVCVAATAHWAAEHVNQQKDEGANITVGISKKDLNNSSASSGMDGKLHKGVSSEEPDLFSNASSFAEWSQRQTPTIPGGIPGLASESGVWLSPRSSDRHRSMSDQALRGDWIDQYIKIQEALASSAEGGSAGMDVRKPEANMPADAVSSPQATHTRRTRIKSEASTHEFMPTPEQSREAEKLDPF